MKIHVTRILGVVAVALVGAAALVGCGPNSDSAAEVGEKAGAAVDKAVHKTGEALEKTGEALQE